MVFDFDKELDEMMEQERAQEAKEAEIFYGKCLKAMTGRDAFDWWVHKATKLLKCSHGEGAYVITDYYFDNMEHFDCSFEEWLLSDNGPIVRHGIKGLFPEFEVITSDKYEIAKLAEEKYGVKLEFDFDGYEVWCLEFNFKEINEKRVDMEKIHDTLKKLVMEEL